MYVIKASGKKEEFNPEKIRGSLTRARVDRAISDKIIEQVEKELFDGMRGSGANVQNTKLMLSPRITWARNLSSSANSTVLQVIILT